MTDEPEYTFIKGQGWVIQKFPFYVFSHSGRTFILEQRTPKPGENYLDVDLTTEIEHSAKIICRYQDTPGDYRVWTTSNEMGEGYKIFVYRELT